MAGLGLLHEHRLGDRHQRDLTHWLVDARATVMQFANPLKEMAVKWYGYPLSPGRERKLDRVWKLFMSSLTPIATDFPADIVLGTPVREMSKVEVWNELQSYKPRTAADVRHDEPWLERRRRLWQRLDRFNARV